ncbi:hypothetical protein T8K17_00245 [Thalassobaculum sp. OXR-137]|uniref:hypothetical protein n=1 Tax=Thalassobaculum sp. OXR-137 TaxID=3100173 RepID=UPI002AC96A3F|nr:hypothetical protein [Thalassobaculum sp. OXR-137]WPZ34577.1 hypothetical protein T8K17_00245 [Thalassobaculum sp. OXR-137]
MRTQKSHRLFSDKLLMATEALGCRTLAELVGRVRTMDASTPITLDRAYKWAQGRATPRDGKAYHDLAQLLDLGEDGAFVRSCSLEHFKERLSRRYPRWRADDGAGRLSSVARPDPAVAAWPTLTTERYATYSLSWAAGRGGQVVRGSSRIATAPGFTRPRIDYVEDTAEGRLTFAGDLRISRNLLMVNFDAAEADVLLSMVLLVSSTPSPAFGGLVIGQSIQPGEARPVCGRLLMVAMDDTVTDPERRNGYHEVGSGSLADDLAGIGYGEADCDAVARSIVGYLKSPSRSDGHLSIAPQAIDEIALPLALSVARPTTRIF